MHRRLTCRVKHAVWTLVALLCVPIMPPSARVQTAIVRGVPVSCAMASGRSPTILRTIRGGGQAAAVDEQTNRVFIIGQAGVVALDATTGQPLPLHSGAVGGAPVAIAIDTRHGHVFTANLARGRGGDPSGSVSMLDATSGRLLRVVPLPGLPSMVAVDERAGRVVTLNGARHSVSILDAVDGRLLRTVPVGDWPDSLAVDARTGRAVVTTRRAVSVLDTSAGAILRTIAITPASGVPNTALAVDELHGHVFVASAPTPDAHLDYQGLVFAMLDATSGDILARITARVADIPFAVDDRTGHIVTATFDAARAHSGVGIIEIRHETVLHNTALGYSPPAALTVARGMGRIFVLSQSPIDRRTLAPTGPGVLRSLDVTTGALCGQSIPVGAVGAGVGRRVVVDQGAKRVFVLDDNAVRVLDSTRL